MLLGCFQGSVLLEKYRPVCTYDCKSWVLSEEEEGKIKAAKIKYLRRIKGDTDMDRIKSDRIREVKMESIEECIYHRQID